MGTTESFKLESLLSVKLEEGRYAATITIKAIDTATPFVSNDIADYLRRHSVVYGFDIVKINETVKILKNGPTGTSILVARGKEMVPGKDGSEQYRFRTTLLAGVQVDNKTDYHERGLVNNVRAGQIIAVIEKEIPGKPGIFVDGTSIEPPPIRCVTVYEPGINVERYVEGNTYTYVTMAAGHARKLMNEIQVTKDFMIEGDLDYTKGNIDFVGNVGISGDVKSGFSVKAAGNISIGGNVEPGAIVKSGKNITVRGVIRCGLENGLFEAVDHITARSVINSRIQAGKNVFVKEYLNDSEVFCGGIFASSWGTLTGNTIEAIGGINVNNIGKEEGLSKNMFYSGRSLLSEERLKKNAEELQNLKNDLALLAKKIAIEQRDTTTASDEIDTTERERIQNVGIARGKHVKQTKERIEFLEQERSFLQQRLSTNHDATMIVKGRIFPTAYLFNGINELKVIDAVHQKVTIEYKEDQETDTDQSSDT